MFMISRETGSTTIWFSNDGGVTRRPVRDLDHLDRLCRLGAVDAKTGNRVVVPHPTVQIDTWKRFNSLSVGELDTVLGKAG